MSLQASLNSLTLWVEFSGYQYIDAKLQITHYKSRYVQVQSVVLSSHCEGKEKQREWKWMSSDRFTIGVQVFFKTMIFIVVLIFQMKTISDARRQNFFVLKRVNCSFVWVDNDIDFHWYTKSQTKMQTTIFFISLLKLNFKSLTSHNMFSV
jgi:hypothetical protein